ncbi:MAG TPA: PPOX class F420-dependent oxidoreductase [Candidatus Dormibacteraeota bacterium]|nr:PPOX class F420-dependent oxidoreductase [Candidatus Dormibacteraeota bacterium]
MPKGPLPASVRELLEAPNMATLATVGPDGAPQATVIWYVMEGDRVLVNSKLGRTKPANLDRDPRVALAIFDLATPYRSVQLRGMVSERREGAAAATDIHLLSRRYTGHEYGEPEARVSYLITVESWSTWGLDEGG